MSIMSHGMDKLSGATLVLGGTGATGRYVVHQLLQLNRSVRVIVRSKKRMIEALQDIDYLTDKSNRFPVMSDITEVAATLYPSLTIYEASITDLSDQQLQEHCSKVDNVVCCLGHTMSFKGMYGHPRRFVSDTVKRFSNILAGATGSKRKFIVMTSDGVPHPSDDPHGFWVRSIMGCIRRCVPPHADNEAAGSYFCNLIGSGNMEWVMVRPTNLQDGRVTKYKLYNKPVGLLFGKQVATRANVAKLMVDLIIDENLFQEYKLRMPVVHDDVPTPLQKASGKHRKKS
jgi:nucleoside-diphosphate-sugar epimerase